MTKASKLRHACSTSFIFVLILPAKYLAVSGLDGQGTVYSFKTCILQQLHPDDKLTQSLSLQNLYEISRSWLEKLLFCSLSRVRFVLTRFSSGPGLLQRWHSRGLGATVSSLMPFERDSRSVSSLDRWRRYLKNFCLYNLKIFSFSTSETLRSFFDFEDLSGRWASLLCVWKFLSSLSARD